MARPETCFTIRIAEIENIDSDDSDVCGSSECSHTRLALSSVLRILGRPNCWLSNYVTDHLLCLNFNFVQLESAESQTRLTVDRLFLTTNFKYFETMFGSRMRESTQSDLELHDIQLVDILHIFNHVLNSPTRCSLCENVDLGLVMLIRLIDSAVYLQCDDEYNKAMQSLSAKITEDTCLDVMLCSYKYTNEPIYSTAMRYCFFYAKTTILKLRRECETYLTLLNQKILNYYINHPMLNLKDKDLLDKLITNLPDTTYFSVENKDATQCAPTKKVNVIFGEILAVKGRLLTLQDLSSPSNPVVLLQTHLQGLSILKSPQAFFGYHTCSFGEKVYITGGEVGFGRGKWNKNIYEINTLTRNVTIIGEIPEPRRHHKSCCTGNLLFVGGGHCRYRAKAYNVFQIDLAADQRIRVLPSLHHTLDYLSMSEADETLSALCGDVSFQLDDVPYSEAQEAGDWRVETNPDLKRYYDKAKAECEVIWYPHLQIPKLG